MDIENLFRTNNHYHNEHKDHHHYENIGRSNRSNGFVDRQPYFANQSYDSKQRIINSLVNNPKFKFILIIAGIFIISAVILIIILLLPFLLKIIDYLVQNGVQGLIEAIWKGMK